LLEKSDSHFAAQAVFFMPVAKIPKLTIKQERFCRKYVALGNASEAYRLVYNAENMKDASVWRKAKELMDNVKVTAMIDKIKSEQSDFQQITFEEIAHGLRAAASGAAAAGQHSAASQALVSLGKLAGIFVEKQKVSVDDVREHLDAVRDLAEVDETEAKNVVNLR